MSISKAALHGAIKAIIEEKYQLVRDSIEKLKASAAEDTKSSAGDKYETGREMIRQEIDKAENMKREYATQLEQLSSIRPEEPYSQVSPGSLVETDRMWIYIAVSLGKIKVEEQEVFVVSPQAPLARIMMGKVAGDKVTFNGANYMLQGIS
ncbi:hypothetical protein GCM10028791_29090 [Echinicola sediminis]